MKMTKKQDARYEIAIREIVIAFAITFSILFFVAFIIEGIYHVSITSKVFTLSVLVSSLIAVMYYVVSCFAFTRYWYVSIIILVLIIVSTLLARQFLFDGTTLLNGYTTVLPTWAEIIRTVYYVVTAAFGTLLSFKIRNVKRKD